MEKRIYDYPKLPALSSSTRMVDRPLFWEYLIEYARMKYEQGADKKLIQDLIDNVINMVEITSKQLLELPDDPELAKFEPNDLEQIKKLRPNGKRKLVDTFDKEKYAKKIQGAVNGRFAGCTLGAPVEFWSIEGMADWAKYCGQEFPPTEYWKKTKSPNDLRYEVSTCEEYELDKLDKVPVDDDVTYTILGLLVLEHCGIDFTTEDIGEVWKKLLPRACTAEEVALNHLNNGISACQAADIENPYAQWIGADIRSDAWGYVTPGLPERAAELAYRDAFLTHRRNGIYGEMYFSAVIAAGFVTDNVEEALRIGLEEIPENCLLAKDIAWALDKAKEVNNFKDARRAVEEHFDWMSGVHTNLNACLTIFGLLLGNGDFTKVIGEITAMGYDNDCNAATAGSIFGAVFGIDAIPKKWYECFNNKVCTYLNEHPAMNIDYACESFTYFAQLIWNK